MIEIVELRRVAVRFVGAPPAGRVARASGVSHVVVDGSILHCLVRGSVQPFLEALHGHEVIGLDAVVVVDGGGDDGPGEDRVGA